MAALLASAGYTLRFGTVRLYKYRDLRSPDGLERLTQILVDQAFWAARPDTLNDPAEFRWDCDYTPTPRTMALLAEVLRSTKSLSAADALHIAHLAIERGRLEAYASPVVALVQARCREEIGLVCFGTQPNSDCLWQRYGGQHEGACIEVDAAAHLLGSQLHPVKYLDGKSLHVDQLLEGSVRTDIASAVYEVALLTKPANWQEEAEVRFVSRRQGVSVRLDASPIVSVRLGRKVPSEQAQRLRGIVANLGYPVTVLDADT